MENIKISVILPTYNERDNIIGLINEISLYLGRYIKKPTEFIVVDDDSDDETWKVVEDYFASEPAVMVVRRIDKRGLASAIRAGIELAKGDIIAWMDCDFSMPPYKLVELLQKLHEGYDVAVGSRFVKGGKDMRGLTDSPLAVILSRAINRFASFILDRSFKDYTSGFAAARRDIFNEIKIGGDHGEYFIEFIYNAHNRGYKIIEIPYYCFPRRKGSSKTGSNWTDYFKRGWKYIILTLKLRFKTKDKDGKH